MRSPNPSVSVLVPVYNKAHYLRRSIDSVLAQTFADFEVVLVDDGSTDNSADVVRTYTDPRIRLVQQPNAGVGAARNRALAESCAPMVALLDADDFWEPGFLAAMMTLAAQHPDAGLLCAPYGFVEPGGRRVMPRLVGVPDRGIVPSYFRSVALGDLVATATSVCVPRTVFESVGVFPLEPLGEDQDMWARIAVRYPVAAISGEPLAWYMRESQGRAMDRRTPDRELPYSVRLQRLIDENAFAEPMQSDVKLYIVAGLLTLVSLNVRAGNRDVARCILADPRLVQSPIKRMMWLILCSNPWLTRIGPRVLDWARGTHRLVRSVRSTD
jgi:glycosyltransferase involved in cell wall biosynthesis